MKKIILLSLVLSLCLSLCACGFLNPKVEGKGYESPEEALLAYAEALQTADISKILSTFAIETYAENYDIEAYMDFMNVAVNHTTYFEAVDEFTIELNTIARQNQIQQQLSRMCIYLSMGEAALDLPLAKPFNGDPYDDAGDLLKEISAGDWAKTLSTIEFGEDFLYLEDVNDDDDFLDTAYDRLDDQCDFYGCDEIVSLALEVELDGEDYVLCMDVARYDDKWYNLQTMGMIGSVMGCPAITGGLCAEE